METSNVIALCALGASLGGWILKLSNKIAVLERAQVDLDRQDIIEDFEGRIVRLETRTEGIDTSLVRIEAKLDRLIERRPNTQD